MRRSCILCIVLVVLVSMTLVTCARSGANHPRPRALSVEQLAAQLGHADWRKRVDAARRLGATRRPDAVAPLARAAGDKDKRVRVAVVRALARIGTRPAAEAMIAVLDGASIWLRPEVADGLAKMPAKVLSGLEAAAEVLVAEMDPAQKSRFALLTKALAAIGESGLAAIGGLRKLTTSRARKILKLLAKSHHKAIAKAASGGQKSTGVAAHGFTPIGVPECDRFLTVFACYVSKMPAAAQGPTRAAFQKTIDAYRKMAAGPARSTLRKSCKMALDAWRKAVNKMPQYQSCFGP